MATLKCCIPGLGGSLGECVVCGKSFAAEIILGQSVDGMRISGFGAQSFPVHNDCGKIVRELEGPWKEIRDKFPRGPLYDCFEQALDEKEAK